MNIDSEYNYDGNFVRMVTVALCKVLGTKIRWINRWSDGKKVRVLIPFYTPFAGQERFILDAFVDDTASTRVELNTDQRQRGIVTFKGGSQRDDEFANPNQYLAKETKINDEFRNIVSRTKAVPITLNYEILIRLDNEWEADTCYNKVLDVLYNYRFFNIEFFGLKIDAFFKLPGESGMDLPREINLGSDDKITMKFNLDVHTYYPVFDVMSDDYEVCENDDTIDWEFLGIPRPQLDLLNLSTEELLTMGISGGTTNLELLNSITTKDGALKRVYWYHNLLETRTKQDIIREKLDNKKNTRDDVE